MTYLPYSQQTWAGTWDTQLSKGRLYMARMTEQQGDVFNYVTNSTPIAHCISADYALGAGIAKEVERIYGVREKHQSYSDAKNRERFG